jgi:hypothetical protein
MYARRNSQIQLPPAMVGPLCEILQNAGVCTFGVAPRVLTRRGPRKELAVEWCHDVLLRPVTATLFVGRARRPGKLLGAGGLPLGTGSG